VSLVEDYAGKVGKKIRVPGLQQAPMNLIESADPQSGGRALSRSLAGL
jgi:hypothetical protein